MKKLLVLIAIACFFFACNDPKDPPDDGMKAKIQAHADSLGRVDSGFTTPMIKHSVDSLETLKSK